MELQNARGVRDYLPEEMIVLNEIMDKLRSSFERAGYNPLSTPVIERMDVLSAKYAGGAEILKETFKLTDQGKRELGLRYDLTVPFSRIVGQNPQLKFPFKRYQMEKVYRDGPIGLGRYREFWQCDIDLVGAKSMQAEAELLSIVEDFFTNLNLKPVIKINNIKFLRGVIGRYTDKENLISDIILIVDKLQKQKDEASIQEVIDLGIEKDNATSIIDTFREFQNKCDEINFFTLEDLEFFKGESVSDLEKEGLDEIETIFNLAKAYGLTKVKFDPSLSRGLSYYTGSIFEVSLEDNKITSTVCAGGRYDKMIQDFLDSKKEYPTVGLSFGLSRIFDAIKTNEPKKTVTQALVYGISQNEAAIKTAIELRKAGINAELDLMKRQPGKNVKYAISMGIPYCVAIGENEINNNVVSLKSKDGWQEVSIEKAIEIIKNN